MSAPTSTAPIAQALIAQLRTNAALKAALDGFHEAVAPTDTKYPWLVYSLHYAPHEYAWGSMVIPSGFDIFIFSRDQVEARNLDQLVITTLHDAALNVSGQSTLFCRRTQDVQSVEIGDDGRRIYQVGGIHEIWTDQEI